MTPLAAVEGTGDRELLEPAMRRDADAIGADVGVADVDLLVPPAGPATIRDFLTFEEHDADLLQGQHGEATIPDEWYRTPAFSFSTPHRVFGPDETVPRPVVAQGRAGRKSGRGFHDCAGRPTDAYRRRDQHDAQGGRR